MIGSLVTLFVCRYRGSVLSKTMRELALYTGGMLESIINAQMMPKIVPATMKSQPRRAIPKRSATSGCAVPMAGWAASYVTWLSSMEAMELTQFDLLTHHPILGKFSNSVQILLPLARLPR